MKQRRIVTGGLEAAILSVLWDRGASTVAEVASALPADRTRHVNTIATVLNRMAARKLVAREDAGRAAVYSAVISREEMGRRCVATLREELLGGSLASFAAALVGRVGGKRGEKHEKKLRRLLAEIEEDERRGR